jgi:hypothetical protein
MPANSNAAYSTLINEVLNGRFVRVSLQAADATGGSATTTLTASVYEADGTTAFSAVREFFIQATSEIGGTTRNTNVTFSAATNGAINSSGSGWALVECNSSGVFTCTVTNATDETAWLSACTAPAGVSTPNNCCAVIGSNIDAVTWSA